MHAVRRRTVCHLRWRCKAAVPATSCPRAAPVPPQMSLCRAKGTRVAWKHLFQQEGAALRFMPFVEIMAPALRFDLFQSGGRVGTPRLVSHSLG